MALKEETTKKKKQQSFNLEYLLRTNGHLFPETVAEVFEYERKFGDTDIIIPEDMQTPSFLEKTNNESNSHLKVVKSMSENYAMAARLENGNQLPDYIKKRMEDDRNKIK